MPSNLEKQIEDERARIVALDSTLDAARTPYLKWQLRLAQHFLDDTKAALRDMKGDSKSAMWVEFAANCLGRATEKRVQVEEVVKKYGGPEHIEEYPK